MDLSRPPPPPGFLSPSNPVIHRCRQAVYGDPGVRLQQINKCASLSSDAPLAMLRFPQNQIANNFIFTPSAMTIEPKAPLSNCGPHLGNPAQSTSFVTRCRQDTFFTTLSIVYMPRLPVCLETVSMSKPSIHIGGPFPPLLLKSNLETTRKLRFRKCIQFMKC